MSKAQAHFNIFKPGILQKVILLVTFSIIVVSVSVGLLFHYGYKSILMQRDLDVLGHDVSNYSGQFQNIIYSLKSDVSFLSTTPPIQGVIRAKKNGIDPQDGSSEKIWRDRLAIIFRQMMQAKPQYQQIRYIGVADKGRELVRAERKDDTILVNVHGGLQQKAGSTYFKETVALKRGDIYLSNIEHNREFGQITEPRTIVLRAAIPVYSASNEVFGVVIINMDLGKVIENTMATQEFLASNIYITNEDGHFIWHKEPERRLSYELGESYSAMDMYSDLNSFFSLNNALITENGLGMKAGKDKVVYLRRVHHDNINPSRYIVIFKVVPSAEVHAGSQRVAHIAFSVSILLAMLSIAVSVNFIRRIVDPLNRVTESISYYSPGLRVIDVPHQDLNNEVGKLASTFDNLQRRLESAIQELGFSKFVLDEYGDSVFWVNQAGVIRYTNKSACERLGYLADSLLGQQVDVIDDRFLGDGWSDCWNETRGGVVLSFDSVHRTKSGQLELVESTLTRIDYEGEEIACLVVRYVSQRKQAEEEIRRSHQQVEDILEGSNDGYLGVNFDWKLYYINAAAEGLFNKNREAVLGQDLWKAFPELEQFFANEIRGAMETGIMLGVDAYCDHLGKWIELNAQPTEEGLSIYFRDITDTHDAQEELIERGDFVHSILSSLEANIAVIDENGVIIEVNEAWNNFAKANGQNVLMEVGSGMNYLESASVAENGVAVSEIRRVLRGEIDDYFLEYPCHSGGKNRWFIMHVTPLKGISRGAVISHIDITHRKNKEDELRLEKEASEKLLVKLERFNQQIHQTEKMASVGQLAAGVAHEINNPIGYVGSNLGTLSEYVSNLLDMMHLYERLEDTVYDKESLDLIGKTRQKNEIEFIREDMPRLLEESREGLTRVRNIVRDLKSFSHVDDYDWRLADIHNGIDSTLNIVNNEIKYKAEIVKEYGVLPEITCLPSQLNQVFMNLFVNAAHAIEDKGVITIRTGMVNDAGIFIEISDTGKGITPEQKRRLFEPFFTTKAVGEGTGLGLSLAYGIIERHNGSIDVQSDVGVGTTFRVELPIEHQKEVVEV